MKVGGWIKMETGQEMYERMMKIRSFRESTPLSRLLKMKRSANRQIKLENKLKRMAGF